MHKSMGKIRNIIIEEIAGENEVKKLGLTKAQINDLTGDIIDRIEEDCMARLIKATNALLEGDHLWDYHEYTGHDERAQATAEVVEELENAVKNMEV